jgi:hypothetical protein
VGYILNSILKMSGIQLKFKIKNERDMYLKFKFKYEQNIFNNILFENLMNEIVEGRICKIVKSDVIGCYDFLVFFMLCYLVLK